MVRGMAQGVSACLADTSPYDSKLNKLLHIIKSLTNKNLQYIQQNVYLRLFPYFNKKEKEEQRLNNKEIINRG
jgi:hypothetical protein